MRFNNKLFLCLILSILFVCCLGMASAVDISVSDISDVVDGDSVVNNAINPTDISNSRLNQDGSQFNDTLNLGNNYKSSKYMDSIVDESARDNNIFDGGYKSSKYDDHIVDESNSSSDNACFFFRCVVSCEMILRMFLISLRI